MELKPPCGRSTRLPPEHSQTLPLLVLHSLGNITERHAIRWRGELTFNDETLNWRVYNQMNYLLGKLRRIVMTKRSGLSV